MAIAAAEPSSARILRNRAKSSTTKLPPKLTKRPPGSASRMAPAVTSSAMAAKSTTRTGALPRNAPSMSSTMAPSPSTISGNTGRIAEYAAALIVSPRHRRGLRAMERMLVIVDQLSHRGRRKVEHRLRIDANQDGHDDKRREHHHLAPAKVADRGEARLFQLAEDDFTVEPQHVGGRQDGAERGQRRHPGIDAEGADQRQELTDESGSARQADIGEREHHEHEGVKRHAVDQPAIGGDLTRMHAVVDHADAKEQGGRHDAVRQHLKNAARNTLRR